MVLPEQSASVSLWPYWAGLGGLALLLGANLALAIAKRSPAPPASEKSETPPEAFTQAQAQLAALRIEVQKLKSLLQQQGIEQQHLRELVDALDARLLDLDALKKENVPVHGRPAPPENTVKTIGP